MTQNNQRTIQIQFESNKEFNPSATWFEDAVRAKLREEGLNITQRVAVMQSVNLSTEEVEQ